MFIIFIKITYKSRKKFFINLFTLESVFHFIDFFKKFGLSLTTDIISKDKDNISQWKPGDIVFFDNSVDE